MWELGGEQPRTIKFRSCDAKKCPICGQYLTKDDECYIVVCNGVPEARAVGLQNIMPHTACWDEFCRNITSNEYLAQKLKKHRPPKARPLTEEQLKLVETFTRAAFDCGYRVCSSTRDNGVRAVKNGTTSALEYNPYSNTISYKDKRKDFLFKSLVDRELVAKVYNKMHEYLGDDKRDDFSALGTIEGIMTEANEMLGET